MLEDVGLARRDSLAAPRRAALDAWACGDIAVRLLLDDVAVREGAWYVLEAQFQAASERLFGVVDVGSEDEVAGEEAALVEPGLRAAIASTRAAAALLATSRTAPAELHRRLVETLAPVCP